MIFQNVSSDQSCMVMKQLVLGVKLLKNDIFSRYLENTTKRK